MHIHQLRYFVVLAEKLNYTATADALYISQPTLSRTIMSLEQELDISLFERNKQNVKLTHAGEIFLKHAKNILSEFDEALTCIRASADGTLGLIKIGVSSIAFSNFLPFIIHRFRTLHSNINLQICDGTVEELLGLIESRHLDIAFTRDYLLENHPTLDRLTLWSDPLYVVLSPKHPLAGQKSVLLSQLLGEKFFAVDRTALLYPPFKELVNPESDKSAAVNVQLISNPSRILTYVESGLGIALLHRHILCTTRSNCAVLLLEDYQSNPEVSKHYNYNAVAIWSKSNQNPCLLPFISTIKDSHDDFEALADCNRQRLVSEIHQP